MAGIKIKRRLGRQYRWFLLGSIPLFALLAVLIPGGPVARFDPGDRFPMGSFLFGLLAVALVPGFGFAVWRLWTLDRHPDLVRLARYGPPGELLKDVEAELADSRGVVRLGRLIQSFRLARTGDDDLASAEVWLTSSWLIFVTEQGNRMQFFRLDRIVQAGRVGNAIHLVDDCGERLEIPGTEAGAARLLAETLMRVPEVFDSFEAKTEKIPPEKRQQIIARIRRSPPGPVAEPEQGQ